MRLIKHLVPGLLLLCAGGVAHAGDNGTDLNKAILDIQHNWAEINYNLADDKKEAAFKKLETKAEGVSAEYPDRAEPLVWEAIILSTHAGVHGGLGALDLVKKSRHLLEKAEKINPDVLNGSVYTSLGSLYYQVPGWPLSFGDDDKAKAYLKKALALNPDGIDPNYFYGDFLYQDGKSDEALAALNKALKAPARPNRPIADAGRRKEIRALIDKINHNG